MFARAAVALLFFVFIILGGMFPETVPGAPVAPRLRAASLTIPGLAASAPTTAVTSLEAAPVLLTVVAPPLTEEALLAAVDGTAAMLGVLTQAQRDASIVVDGVTTREPVRVPKYYTYEVQEGDNVSSIAERFGLESGHIIWNNPDVSSNPDSLSIGDRLQIPSVPGVLHWVRLDETLTQIAIRYGVEWEDIVAFSANDIDDPNVFPADAQILVVGGRGDIAPLGPGIRPPVFVARDASSAGYLWPVLGPITSQYGWDHPLGIDIGAGLGTEVLASRAGKVILARGAGLTGWERYTGYGYHIEIDHGGGITTLYAHLDDSVLLVEEGQWVERNQVIAYVGDTGRTTGTHLHFEVNVWGWPDSPWTYLD